MTNPLLGRTIETTFRRLSELSWHVSARTDVDQGLRWLADFSAWFREQCGANVGHDLHLLYGRQITLFLSSISEIGAVADRIFELGANGFAIAIHVPSTHFQQFEDQLMPVSEAFSAILLDISSSASVADIKRYMKSQIVRKKSLTIVCDADVLLQSDLHESFGGQYVTFVPRRNLTDAWVVPDAQSAAVRRPSIRIDDSDRIFWGESEIGCLQVFDPTAIRRLVDDISTEMRLALDPASVLATPQHSPA